MEAQSAKMPEQSAQIAMLVESVKALNKKIEEMEKAVDHTPAT